MIRLAVIIAIIVGGAIVIAAAEWRSRRQPLSDGQRHHLAIAVRQAGAVRAMTGDVPGRPGGTGAPAARQPGMGWLARRPHTQHLRQAKATAEHQACNRCRTGSAAFRCTCGTGCDAPACAGWWADAARSALRGDA